MKQKLIKGISWLIIIGIPTFYFYYEAIDKIRKENTINMDMTFLLLSLGKAILTCLILSLLFFLYLKIEKIVKDKFLLDKYYRYKADIGLSSYDQNTTTASKELPENFSEKELTRLFELGKIKILKKYISL